MSNERACICPKCKVWYYVNKKNANPECPECKSLLVSTDISSDDFDAMLASRNHPPKKKNENTENQKHKEPSDSSFWITIVETLNILIIVLSIIVGGISASGIPNVGAGLVVFFIAIIVGYILASSSMVFVVIAKDIKAIRNALENNE